MDINTIKKSSIVCLQTIRNRCDQFTRSLSEHFIPYANIRQNTKLKINNSRNPQFLSSQNPKRSFFSRQKIENASYITRSIQIPKKFIKIRQNKNIKARIFQSIHISKKNKHTFAKIIEKFHKCHHPSNASKGQNSTSSQLSNFCKSQPTILRFRSVEQQKVSRSELKKMSILSQVIQENNKKQRRRIKQRGFNHKNY